MIKKQEPEKEESYQEDQEENYPQEYDYYIIQRGEQAMHRTISEEVMKNKTPAVWTSDNESILFEWCDNAQCYIWLHNRSSIQCSFYYSLITIPCIVLSTITGSAALATNSFPKEIHFYEFIVIGTINIFVGILNMLEHFLKFSQRKESHRLSAISWDKFMRNIRVELAKKPTERMEVGHFLNLCNREYDHLIELAPVISNHIIYTFNQTFSGAPGSLTRKRFDELKKPEICDSIITAHEEKYKKQKKEIPEETQRDDLERIHMYIYTFHSMFGRKPLTYELIDNLKDKIHPEILGPFLENYSMEHDTV